MSGISTHVLDTASGKPATSIRVRLYREANEISSASTDGDGRCANLLPPGTLLEAGIYRLIFDVGNYFPDGFYPEVSISFAIRNTSTHYHVPLLISPFGFTTYRGS